MRKPRGRCITRRRFIASAAAGAAGLSLASCGRGRSRPAGAPRKVIVIGIDGMDPRLCRRMMEEGLLPNLKRLSASGGFSDLGTSTPPQSPVAWATFINGSGPGSHGIFDFIHRHPHDGCKPFYSAAETLEGKGHLDIGDHRLQLDLWPFNHEPPRTVLRRQGTPFWHWLDAARIPSVFYDLPSNYPPSPSDHGYHRSISGMGVPDMLGTYGTYQYFGEDAPAGGLEEGGGRRSHLLFEGDSAASRLVGPMDSLLQAPKPIALDFEVHRDRASGAALIEIGEKKILLERGRWSRWTRLDFPLSTPAPLPGRSVRGICRFLLQEVSPTFRLYATPINIDPAEPAVRLSEPAGFMKEVAMDLGPFYTTGFKEDHKARTNGIFSDEEFLEQSNLVLEERLALLERAMKDYDDGLFFFYFSSGDLQSHMFWWNAEEGGPHPTRSSHEAELSFDRVKRLYRRLDGVIGEIDDRHGASATIIVMSDHGFANFGRQFNLNSWLRDHDYLNPRECSAVLANADWSRTRAYGLGINGLYLNLKGRERDGIVEPGEAQEKLTRQLIARLQAVRDVDGSPVIRRVHRSSEIYTGPATELAPDLIIGYARGYRASWETCLGDLTEDVLLDNKSAWSADHCADALEVPGVVCSNRPIRAQDPSLIDVAPSILSEFGLPTPSTMSGRSIFG